jgi:hypothetical protein
MKLFAGSLLLILCLMPLPFTPEGRVRCTCRPSPPGGVTTCQPGQTAICGGRKGVCQGSCISPSAQLQPLQYSAALLSAVTGKNVTEPELKKDPKASKKALEDMLKLGEQGKSGKIKFNGTEHDLAIGLSDVAKSKLKDAIKLLATLIPLGLPIPRIRFP